MNSGRIKAGYDYTERGRGNSLFKAISTADKISLRFSKVPNNP
jgi:hypothetical protein